VIAFFTPKSAAEALGFEIIEGGNLVERPVGVDRSGPFEVGTQDDFGLR